MNKKIIGIVLAVMLSILLIESYVLFNLPKQALNSETGTSDSTSSAVTSPSLNELSELSNNTVNPAGSEVSFVPAVPEFTVALVNNSYDVPATVSIDPFTGEKVTHPGYRVENRSIEIRIKNQPFTPYVSNGRNITLYYNVSIKGHYEEHWEYIYNPDDMPTISNSEHTVIPYESEGGAFHLTPACKLLRVPIGGQVDFRVEALIGYIHAEAIGSTSGWFFSGKTSGWSGTQTLTIS